MVARRAHNPKVVGSNPAPATSRKKNTLRCVFFFLLIVWRGKFELAKAWPENGRFGEPSSRPRSEADRRGLRGGSMGAERTMRSNPAPATSRKNAASNDAAFCCPNIRFLFNYSIRIRSRPPKSFRSSRSAVNASSTSFALSAASRRAWFRVSIWSTGSSPLPQWHWA